MEYYKGDGKWIALEMPFYAAKGLKTREILALVVKSWKQINCPLLPTVAVPLSGAQDTPPSDEHGQPKHFC